jgi:hypothetical protein
MDRWEYLINEPYTLRHHMAAYAMKNMPYVVDVGTYKVKCQVDGKLFCIDPLKTIDDSYHGTVKEWMIENYEQINNYNYGVIILGLQVDGDDGEFEAAINLIKNSKVTVLDVPTEHKPSVQQYNDIIAKCNKKIQVEANFIYPQLNTPGFSPFVNRNFYILKGDIC